MHGAPCRSFGQGHLAPCGTSRMFRLVLRRPARLIDVKVFENTRKLIYWVGGDKLIAPDFTGHREYTWRSSERIPVRSRAERLPAADIHCCGGVVDVGFRRRATGSRNRIALIADTNPASTEFPLRTCFLSM